MLAFGMMRESKNERKKSMALRTSNEHYHINNNWINVWEMRIKTIQFCESLLHFCVKLFSYMLYNMLWKLFDYIQIIIIGVQQKVRCAIFTTAVTHIQQECLEFFYIFHGAKFHMRAYKFKLVIYVLQVLSATNADIKLCNHR